MNLKPYPKYKDSGIEWLGKVPEEWEVKKLKYIAEDKKFSIVDGPFGTQLKAEDYQDEGVPLIRINNLSYEGKVDDKDIVYISETKAKELRRSSIKKQDIVIGKTGATIGKSGINDKFDYAIIASSCLKISSNKNKIFPKFLNYFMISYNFQDSVLLTAGGSTRDTINISPFSNLYALLLSYYEQESISTFLDQKTTKIDELLKKNEKLVELLKEKRQAVISHAVTKGLNPNAKMRDSGIEWIGEVPEGWEVRKLKYLTTEKFKNGIFKKKEFYGSGIKLINVFDVYRQDFYIEIESLDRVEVTSQEVQTYSVKAGDIVFVRSSLKLEGVGASACVPSLSEPLLFECHLVKLQPSSKIIPEYLINFLNSSIVRQRLIALANTVTMATLGQSALTNIEVELPPIFEQQAILKYLKNETARIDGIIKKIQSQIEKLKEYRQALISNVVTGKVRVAGQL